MEITPSKLFWMVTNITIVIYTAGAIYVFLTESEKPENKESTEDKSGAILLKAIKWPLALFGKRKRIKKVLNKQNKNTKSFLNDLAKKK